MAGPPTFAQREPQESEPAKPNLIPTNIRGFVLSVRNKASDLLSGQPKFDNQHTPNIMNAAPPMHARSQPRSSQIIDLVSDDEDEDDSLDNSLVDFDSSDGEVRRFVTPGDEPEPVQPNGLGAMNMGMDNVNAPLQHSDLGAAIKPDPFGFQQWQGDYIHDDDFEDEEITRLIMEDLNNQAQPQLPGRFSPPPFQPPLQDPGADLVNPSAFDGSDDPNDNVEPVAASRNTCIVTLLSLFPDICQDHVSELYDKVSQSSDQLIAHVLDRVEKGHQYPKSKDKQKTLKRKREVDENAKYTAVDRKVPLTWNIRNPIKEILTNEFHWTTASFIDAVLEDSRYGLFIAYRVLEEAERTWSAANPPYPKLKNCRKKSHRFQDDSIDALISSTTTDQEIKDIYRELIACRAVRDKGDLERAAELLLEEAEITNEKKAQDEGTMSECGCCFGDYPLNRMIHCNTDDDLHWFCKGCARQTAETEIGNSKYELHCMSMDGCKAGFSNDQRSQFLDSKTIVALERNEQEANLRMAGIENLASCPFCPFAAEYPPVEIDKEFRCQDPECERVSCRLCKLESHIPKSCEEFAKANGLSVRRQIEEAMSAAMIRKCNKCATPFVKEEGCNKMTCTRNGCRNVQCYVCSKSCAYDHFNDAARGGKDGNCPLFEREGGGVEGRHAAEVEKAEKEARDKVRMEHPEYTEDDLKIKVSDDVLKDDEQRKARHPGMPPNYVRRGMPHFHGFPQQGDVIGHDDAMAEVLAEHDAAINRINQMPGPPGIVALGAQDAAQILQRRLQLQQQMQQQIARQQHLAGQNPRFAQLRRNVQQDMEQRMADTRVLVAKRKQATEEEKRLSAEVAEGRLVREAAVARPASAARFPPRPDMGSQAERAARLSAGYPARPLPGPPNHVVQPVHNNRPQVVLRHGSIFAADGSVVFRNVLPAMVAAPAARRHEHPRPSVGPGSAADGVVDRRPVLPAMVAAPAGRRRERPRPSVGPGAPPRFNWRDGGNGARD